MYDEPRLPPGSRKQEIRAASTLPQLGLGFRVWGLGFRV